MKKKDLVKKWLDNESLTTKELEAFKKLDAYGSYMKLSETAKKFAAPAYDVEDSLQNLHSKLSESKDAVIEINSRRSYVSLLTRIAAIFVLGIGLYFMFFKSDNTHIETLASQKLYEKLPDQSVVEINALSTIEYQKEEWDDHREIKLKGEAYFKVAKGKKFDVHTDVGIVSVLGTQFNIKQRQDYFEVTCYEGLVSVIYKNQVIKLSAGKVFKVIDDEVLNSSTTLTQPSWTENQSNFISTPYKYILQELEIQYGVTITSKNIDLTKLFTGNFVHSNLQMALRSITIPMQLKFEIKDNHVTLYKE